MTISTVTTVEEVLEATDIGCGLHSYAVDGGSINVPTEQLRAALEEAYDPSMPGWESLVEID
jgi:hypothetical protein